MFARRKRDQREDEPLVPHGFLWQATDEPEADKKPPSPPSTPAEPIEMPRRQEFMPNFRAPAPPMQEPVAEPALPSNNEKLGAISPPIPWPSPKTTSVIRRATPAKVVPPQAPADNPSRQDQAPPLRTQAALPSVPAATIQNRKIEIIELQNSDTAVPSRGRESLRDVVRFVREHYSSGRQHVSRVSVKARHRARSVFRSIDAPGRLRRLKPLAQNGGRRIVMGCRLTMETATSKWNSNSPRITGLAWKAGTMAATVTRTSLTRTADLGRRLRNYRVHIRVPKSPFLEELTARSKLVLLARQQAFRREPRLWTSMAMAALSALLTMALISVLHRGVDASVPNRGAATPQAVAPVGVIAPSTALAETGVHEQKSRRPVLKIAATKASSVSSETEPANAVRKRAARIGAHHNDDEDYVAPDTYHYYGNGRSR